MNGDRMVTLLRYEMEGQAQYHLEVLQQEGIDAVVVDTSASEDRPVPDTLPSGSGPILLQVREEDAKRAGEVLEEFIDYMMGGEQHD